MTRKTSSLLLPTVAVLLAANVGIIIAQRVDPGFGVDAPTICESDLNCKKNEYCAQGVCALYGMCTNDLDCTNPSNVLLTDERCIGYLYCNEYQECQRMCGEPCPDGFDQTDCTVSACDTKIAVPGAVSCAPDVCDINCGGIYFDSRGYQVFPDDYDNVDPEFGVEPPVDPEFGVEPPVDPEFGVEPPVDPEFGVEPPVDPEFGVEPPVDPGFAQPVDPEFGVEPPVDPEFGVEPPVDPEFGVEPPVDPGFGVEPPKDCKSDKDCVKNEEYCAKGLCAPFGACIDDFDCMNPANGPFADKMCIGYQFCNENQLCDRMCGEECATKGQTQPNCAVTECDMKIAVPDAVSCAPAPCDEDCLGIYYDKQGFVLYNEDNIDPGFGVDPPVDCSSDKDCVKNDEYCAQGVCAPMGMCTNDLDCFNPANIIMMDIKCIGYQYCNENKQCDRMCGTPCQDGSDQTDCAVSGCDTKIAVPGAVSCAPDVCDTDCGGIYFDSKGYEVHKDGPPQDCMNNMCPTHEGAYCDDAGNCLVVGNCSDDADCFNPYNDPYAVAYCVGNVKCMNGLCLNDCDPIIGECGKSGAETIVDVICSESDLTTLCNVLKSKPQIMKKLSGGDFTVFAPIDDSFDRLPNAWDIDLGFHIVNRSVPISALDCKAGDNLLMMINGKNTRTMCTNGSKTPTVQKGGGNTQVSLFPEFLGNELYACNGIVHKMSNVLLHKPEAVPYDFSK